MKKTFKTIILSIFPAIAFLMLGIFIAQGFIFNDAFAENGNGGGFFVGSNSKLEVKNGTIISGNKAESGGGVFVAEGGEFFMTGGTIFGNTATTGEGNDIYNAGTFTISGGTVGTSGSLQSQNGIYNDFNGKMEIKSGTIHDNVYNAGFFETTDKATINGTITLENSSKIIVKDYTSITPNLKIQVGNDRPYGNVIVTFKGSSVSTTPNLNNLTLVGGFDSENDEMELVYRSSENEWDVKIKIKQYYSLTLHTYTKGSGSALKSDEGGAIETTSFGQKNSSGDFVHDSSITITAIENEGYSFGGWFQGDGVDGESFSSSTSLSFTITDNVTYSALFVANTFTITLNSGGDTFNNGYTFKVTYGERVKFDGGDLPIPSKAGYSFTRWVITGVGLWFTDSNNNNQIYSNINGYIKDEKWIYIGNISLYAQWSAKIIHVTLDPTTGGVFSVSNKGTTDLFFRYGETTIYKNYANGTFSNPTTTIVCPTMSGYDFNGYYEPGVADWVYANGTINIEKFITITTDRTLKASWNGHKCEVTFDANGGTLGLTSWSFTYGSSPIFFSATRSGYVFVGWFSQAVGGVQISEDQTGIKGTTYIDSNGNWKYDSSSLTIYAQWQRQVTITLQNNASDDYNGQQYVLNYGTDKSVSLPTPESIGRNFTNWSCWFYSLRSSFVDLGREYMYSDKISIHLSAWSYDWSKVKDQRLISCTQGGGWNIEGTSSNGSENVVFTAYDSGVGYKSVDSTVKWADLSSGWHTFDMVFDGNYLKGYIDGTLVATSQKFSSGKIGYNSTNTILVGAEPSADPSNPEGLYFDGYIDEVMILHSNSKMSSSAFKNKWIVPYNDITLIATWESQTYNVTFNTNNGTFSDGTTAKVKSVTYGSSYSSAFYGLTNPTMTGYTFDGWWTEKTGGTRITSSSTVYAVDDKLVTILYAHWKVAEYTVTFNSNEGSFQTLDADWIYETDNKTASHKFTFGTQISFPTAPSRYGYEFIGWFDSPEGGNKIDENQKVTTEGLIFYAHWDGNVITATLYVKEEDTNPYTRIYYKYGELIYYSSYNATTKTLSNKIIKIDLTNLNTKIADSYDFCGFYWLNYKNDENYKIVDTDGTITTNLAKFNSSSNCYAYLIGKEATIIHEPNGGTIKSWQKTEILRIGSQPNPVYPDNVGYYLVGWFDENCTKLSDGVSFYFNVPGYIENGEWIKTGETTIYAYWLPIRIPVRVDANGNESSTGGYYLFGGYPQTYKNVEIFSGKTNENGYYFGKDGYFYAKSSNKNAYKTNNGTVINYSMDPYFRVEPIKWKILETRTDETHLLLCENIIDASNYSNVSTNSPFTVEDNCLIDGDCYLYGNSYYYSDIRAWLNGYKGTWNNVDYTNNGFLQKIGVLEKYIKSENLTIKDSAYSTAYDNGWFGELAYRTKQYNVGDKIFLLSNYDDDLSYLEIKNTTDYARSFLGMGENNTIKDGITYVYDSWWLRVSTRQTVGVLAVYLMSYNGNKEYKYEPGINFGVVPALVLDPSGKTSSFTSSQKASNDEKERELSTRTFETLSDIENEILDDKKKYSVDIIFKEKRYMNDLFQLPKIGT